MDMIAQRRARVEAEGLSSAAARGLVACVWRRQKDRPDRAFRTILHTLLRWSTSCDAIAAAGRPYGPAPGEVYRVRLTAKGLAYLAAQEAGR
jgi:hypothetical protein